MATSLDGEQRQSLEPASSVIPGTAAPADVARPSQRHRLGYARASSVSFIDERYTEGAMDQHDQEEDITDQQNVPARCGLGIEVSSTSQVSANAPRRVPVGSKRTSEQKTPNSAKSLLSPSSAGGLSGSTRYEGVFDCFDSPYPSAKHSAKLSASSLDTIKTPSVYQTSQSNLLPAVPTTYTREECENVGLKHVCSSSKRFKKGMNNWLAIIIVTLSVFSTVFSGAFLIIALAGPEYHNMIGKDGSLTISSAAFLTSFFAKMIELSFVTVVVAFLGQSLSRRAYRRQRNAGVTLAEMSMRSWIVQPGTMFTHWQSVRYAAASWLGIMALVAAIMAMLYTSAATALVQPQLKFSGWEKRTLQGPVMASFANGPYIQKKICKTPITESLDDDQDIEDTCISLEHASQAYHNYMHWIGTWTDVALGGNGTRELSTRPPGWAILNDNTTITAPWIEQIEPYTWRETGWFINNITMAMPHPGVVSAALDPANGMMQPDELNGLGIYSIQASVPVPFVNVLCAMGMSASQLKPIVYRLWDGSQEVDPDNWPEQLGKFDYDYPYLGGTPFDDIFEWGEKYGSYNWPPIFGKLPGDYNTIANDTTQLVSWGRSGVYILGKGGATDAIGSPTDDNFALCQLRVGQTPHCSTRYNASSNVGTLEALCNDPDDDMRYIKSLSNATSGEAGVSADWPNIASMWLSSLSLNNGMINTNSSNSRLWTEFILTNSSVDWLTRDVQFSNALPSPAEALAVMSGCTLLQSAQDAPFVEFWNYSAPYLDEPQTQWFNASVRAQRYASGGTPGYQKVFFIVLFTVCIMNIMVLIYWFVRREWYTDFSDPTNLFSLAINSPRSEKLAECSCCDELRSGERFKYNWTLGNEGGHLIMESPDIEEMESSPNLRKCTSIGRRLQPVKSPIAKTMGLWKKSSPRVAISQDDD